jgi:hypothetical protein
MITMIPSAKRLVVGAVAVGALSLGAAGVGGAAGIGGAATTATTPAVAKHFNCANAAKVLARIDKGEARIAAGLPKLTAAEAKATQAGHAKLAARLQKWITRLESSQFKARLTRASSAIEAKCHVSAPGMTSGSSTGSTAQA